MRARQMGHLVGMLGWLVGGLLICPLPAWGTPPRPAATSGACYLIDIPLLTPGAPITICSPF